MKNDGELINHDKGIKVNIDNINESMSIFYNY